MKKGKSFSGQYWERTLRYIIGVATRAFLCFSKDERDWA
jgi:hypothetical protein